MTNDLNNNDKHGHRKIKICVSGAAETGHCGPNALEKAKELGREIVRQNGILVTGATTGFPLWASIGAKEANGISVGLSPAATEREHTDVYRLPIDYMDLILYTGFGYQMRDILLTRTSDAVILGCGRIGTIHEFTVAFEDNKPIGILEDAGWEIGDEIRMIIEKGHRPNQKIVFDSDPKELVRKVIELIEKDKIAEFELVK